MRQEQMSHQEQLSHQDQLLQICRSVPIRTIENFVHDDRLSHIAGRAEQIENIPGDLRDLILVSVNRLRRQFTLIGNVIFGELPDVMVKFVVDSLFNLR